MEDKMQKNEDKGLQAQTGLQNVVVREFKPVDNTEVQQIFYKGMMEMVPDTAFRGLRHHPESLLLYTAMTVVCSILTMCWWLIGLLPAIVLCGRYLYSRRVIHGSVQHAMNTDMGDIEGFYTNSSDSCLWVAVLEGKVVGVVAAEGQQKCGGVVKLQRMSVDPSYRRCGVGMALGQKVLEFAATRGHTSVVLGTTAYTPAAHQLYQRLGFRCVAVSNGYITPGATSSLLEQMFYRVRHHHYSLNMQNSEIPSNGQPPLGDCKQAK